jgi:hypothetical protein
MGKKIMDVLKKVYIVWKTEYLWFINLTVAQFSIQSSEKEYCVIGWTVPDVPKEQHLQL